MLLNYMYTAISICTYYIYYGTIYFLISIVTYIIQIAQITKLKWLKVNSILENSNKKSM